jgi:chromosome segregation protein
LQSEALTTQLAYLRSPDAAHAFESAQAATDTARQQKQSADQVLAASEQTDAAEKEGDAFAAHLAAIIEHGEHMGLQDGHCPLCAALRKPEEFAAAIADSRKRLAARGERLAASARTVTDARAGVERAAAALSDASLKLAAETERRLIAEQRLAAIRRTYSENQFDGSAEKPTEAQKLILSEQERASHGSNARFTFSRPRAQSTVCPASRRR